MLFDRVTNVDNELEEETAPLRDSLLLEIVGYGDETTPAKLERDESEFSELCAPFPSIPLTGGMPWSDSAGGLE